MLTIKNNSSANAFCLILLLIICIIAYWPISFHIYSLKNDALNYFLPVRYQISDFLNNGDVPFWSPYFNMGYPLHGDMQSGVWNPIVQIFSLFGAYTLRSLQYETILYVYLSGVGMYFLVQHLVANWKISLLAGVSFMLCGFNSDSAQFLNWISSASFFPFCFLFYIRMIGERKIKHVFAFSIFIWLLFTTAYPADFIISGYLFLSILVWHLIKKENRKKDVLIIQLKFHLIALLLFILLSLPAIISFAEFLPLSERGSGADYKDVMSNSFHPSLFFTYLTPLPAWKATFASATDPLERNTYFGLITFILFIAGILIPSYNRLMLFTKWAFAITALFSLGEWGGIRILSYYFLPLMDTFRHPANSKVFSIFFACLTAAFALKHFLYNESSLKKKAAWLGVLIVFLGFFVWLVFNTHTLTLFYNFNTLQSFGLKQFLDSASFGDLLLINIVLQLPFLLAIYFVFVKKIQLKALLIIAIFNSTTHTMLFQPFTVVKNTKASTVQNLLNQFQTPGFPTPDFQATIEENSRNGEKYFDEIGTLNMYSKKIGRVDYRITPSNLLIQNQFWFNEHLRSTLMQMSLFYRAEQGVTETNLSGFSTSGPKPVILADTTNKFFNVAEYKVSVVHFKPSDWKLRVQCSEPGFYTLFQNFYPRWDLYINGKKEKIEKTNISFIGFSLPPGSNIVQLKYRYWDLLVAYFISLITLLSLLVIILKKNKLNSIASKERNL